MFNTLGGELQCKRERKARSLASPCQITFACPSEVDGLFFIYALSYIYQDAISQIHCIIKTKVQNRRLIFREK